MKMFKKVIALATSAVMLVSCTAFAEMSIVDEETVMTFDTATVTINCGADYAGKKITAVVYEPTSDFEALSSGGTYTETNSQTVNATISATVQKTADASGKITFTYKPKGPKGKYFVRIGGEGVYEHPVISFDFVSDGEAQSIIDELKLAPTVANVENIFVKNQNPNVYTKYQMLDVDDATMYPVYDSADGLIKTAVHTYISGKMNTVSTPADFITLFNKAVYVEVLNAKTGSDLLIFIDANKAYSGLNTEKEYTNIRENTEYFNATVEAKALEAIAAANMSGMDIAASNTVIKNALLNSALSYCGTFGTLGNLILGFEAEITANGGNVAGYKNSETPYDIAQTLKDKQPFENMAAFITELNAIVGAATTTTPGNPGGIIVDTPSNTGSTGGSGGGGGFGGGNTVSRPANTQTVLADGIGNGTSPSDPAQAMFTDIGGHEWAKQAIMTLKEKNIINGKSATEFAPADTVLREEFAKMIMLAVLSANVQSATATDFTDVDPNAWYAPYIAAATKSGVINGYGSTFGLGDTIRREDMAVMCYRAIKAAGITLNAEREAHKFTDAISDYAKEAIASMYAAGLINGYSETEFNGNGTATRAEAAMILYNVVQKYM